ncbi:hypothetical protein ACFLZJ_01035 [Nanoarchaeota archaeon]
MVKKKKFKGDSIGLGISGFTLGIVSLILIIFNAFLGVLLAIVGLIFCIVQMKRKKTKLAKWGMGINIVGIIFNAYLSYLFIQTLITLLNQNPALLG